MIKQAVKPGDLVWKSAISTLRAQAARLVYLTAHKACLSTDTYKYVLGEETVKML
jgi:protein involved in temperature-dependent protein secretion